MMPFDSSSSVEQICDRVLLTSNYFNLILSVEKNLRDQNLFCSSNFRAYRVNVRVEGIRSHHTLLRISCWVKLTVSRLMFGPPPLVTLIKELVKIPNNL